jgi:hypothetical protein
MAPSACLPWRAHATSTRISGKRACIRASFAELEPVLVLATIARRFRLELTLARDTRASRLCCAAARGWPANPASSTLKVSPTLPACGAAATSCTAVAVCSGSGPRGRHRKEVKITEAALRPACRATGAACQAQAEQAAERDGERDSWRPAEYERPAVWFVTTRIA